MADNAKIVRIFVASPDDVLEERKRLDQVVQSINIAHAERTGVHLDVLGGKQNTYPGFSTDAQAVINDQISQYDIFIGIMWLTIGSPTPRADSGTIEEYERAKACFDQDQKSIELMWYFKTASPLSMENFDPDQYGRVLEFKKQVSTDGGFYKEFTTSDNFAQLLHIHLIKAVNNWQKNQEEKEQPDEAEKGEATGTSERDEHQIDAIEEGLLDLEDKLNEETDALVEVLESIGKSMEEMSDSLGTRTEDLLSLQQQSDTGRLSSQEKRKLRIDVRRVVRSMAGDMDRFSEQVESRLPSYKEHSDRVIEISTNVVPIYLEFDQDATELKEAVHKTFSEMQRMITTLEEGRDSVHTLPRITTDLIRARKRVEKVLQEYIDILRNGATSFEEVVSMLP